MSKKAKTPAAPNYTQLAHEQAALDNEAIRSATNANRINQTNPFASLSYTQTPGAFDQAGYDAAMAKYNADLAAYNQQAQIDPNGSSPTFFARKNTTAPTAPTAVDKSQFYGDPTWTQEVKLNEADQANLDQMRGITGNLTGQAASAMSSPFDISGAPEMPDSGFGAVQEIQDAMMSRMAPDLLRRRAAEEARLTAQGVGTNTNSASWDRMQSDLGRNENDASMQALLAGAKEYGNIYDRGMTNRNQWLTEQTAMRQLPLQELTAMLRNQQSYAAPQFQGFYNQSAGAGADILGAAQQQYGSAVDKANADAKAKSNMWGTIGSIGGSLLAFSDERLKSNIKRIGTHPSGFGIYNYDIFGHNKNGVLAQEVLQVIPEAVTLDSSGFYKVDYGRLQ